MASPLTVYAITTFGGISGSSSVWETVQTGSPTLGLEFNSGICQYTIASYGASTYYVEEACLGWDTSGVGAGNTVTDAVISLACYDTDADNGLVLDARAYDWSAGGVTTADWRTATQFQALPTLGTYNTASGWNTETYYSLTGGTGGPAWVNITGTSYAIVCVTQFWGSAPTGTAYAGWYSANNAGTTYDPKLVVTYGAAGIPIPLLNHLLLGD